MSAPALGVCQVCPQVHGGPLQLIPLRRIHGAWCYAVDLQPGLGLGSE